MDFSAVPQELKDLNQWVLWRYENRTKGSNPTKVPYCANSGKIASVSDVFTWGSFLDCVSKLNCDKYNKWAGIGFVLSKNDPYTFIDLDDSEGNQDVINKQMQIFEKFVSYSERSPSGKGLHIIVKGNIPSGKRRSKIEIYSSERYMTITGDVFVNSPIKYYNGELNELWSEFDKVNNGQLLDFNLELKEDDISIIERANKAVNGNLFQELFRGNWQVNYPSQSEADFALIDIIAFYTKNKEQIIRIFFQSGLGKRPKAKRIDYLNYMLNRCFDNQLPLVDIDFLKSKIENKIIEKKGKTGYVKSIYSFPQGLVGAIAQFIFDQAPRPVSEVALVGALGFIAGIVGRAYNISGTGLNQYFLLLGSTGIGKEAIADGIDKIMIQVLIDIPAAADFVGPAEISSPQAIIKYMATGKPCFVSLLGEFGILMQQMTKINAQDRLVGLRRFLLDVFNKSGENRSLRSLIYSDKDKNTPIIKSPSISLIGESTPEKFYDDLHEGLIAEGLLPRFTTFEYLGDRPHLNKDHFLVKPSKELIKKIADICAYSLMLNSENKVIQIRIEIEAEKLMDEFDRYCDDRCNESREEALKNLWVRGHVKALKLAGTVAVGVNASDPIITTDLAQWSIELIYSDIKNFLAKFISGEIGLNNEEQKQFRMLSSIVKDYLTNSYDKFRGYLGKEKMYLKMHSDNIVPYCFLQRRLISYKVFKKDKMGATYAIKRTLKTLCETGDLQELDKITLTEKYNTKQQAYMLKDMRILDND